MNKLPQEELSNQDKALLDDAVKTIVKVHYKTLIRLADTQDKIMRSLTLLEAEHVSHQLAIELMDYTGEPIPPFSTRYPHKLESCLQQPFQGFGTQEFYPTLHYKAAVMFYFVIKNHPFRNGNKRMAIALTLTFLFINNYLLQIPTDELYDISILVAHNKDNVPMEKVVSELDALFEKYSVERI